MKKLWLLIILFILTACGAKNNDKVVKIGIIRVPNDTVVAIHNHWIQDAFKTLGLDVEFRFFDSGVAMNQAFASGALDIAEMGFTNGVVALAKNLPVELFWIHEVLGESEALVVKDVGITNVSQLRGKKIATVFSSTSHLSLLKTLEKAGLTPQDVSLLNMETAEIVAAWNRNDLDAAYSWEPTLSNIKKTGHVLVSSLDLAGEGIMTTNIGLVHTTFSKNHPEAVMAFIKAMDKSYQLRESDFEAVVDASASYIGIDRELARAQLNGTQWISKEALVSDKFMGPNGKFLEIFKETAIFWKDNGFINEVPSDQNIRSFINPFFIQEVIDHD